MEYSREITLCEVGLRDGLQSEKSILTTSQKIELVNDMVEAGFKVIEIGSFVSPKAVPQMADTDEVFKGIEMKEDVEYRALIANARGVDRAAACGCRKVKLNVSASTAHNLANLNCTPEQSVAGFAACVEKAKENAIGISGSISMAFGSPWDKEIPIEVVKRIVDSYMNVGINEISLSDAAGVAYPSQVYDMAKEMKAAYPEVKWWFHFHNTRGLGIANVLAGLEAGMTNFDASFSGVGGCPFVPGAAGNVTTEDVLHMCNQMGIHSTIDLDQSIAISRKTAAMLGHTTESYMLRAGKASELIRELPKGQIKNQTAK